MLPAAHRMRRSVDFAAAVRGGRRSARPTVVLHVRSRPACNEPALVGLVVSKSVGNSVIRHRVARRLRAVCSAQLEAWQPGDLVVVRALSRAATATYADLESDVQRAAGHLQGASDAAGARS
ncbi:MAG: ribonuclease P protein component [Actinomycetes bacterium]